METLSPKTSSLLKRIARWVLLITVFVFLGRITWENWSQVRGTHFFFRVGPLALSTLIFVFSYSIEFWAWYLIPLKTRESWFYSQLGKYLYGKVWFFLGRLYLYGSKGKSRKTFTVAPYFEMLTLVMAAGLIFLVSLFFERNSALVPLYGLTPKGWFRQIAVWELMKTRKTKKVYPAIETICS